MIGSFGFWSNLPSQQQVYKYNIEDSDDNKNNEDNDDNFNNYC
jgi:hypothetical protein